MTEDEVANYLVGANGSPFSYRFGFNPNGHNTGIYVTDHRYYLRWEYGLDFESQAMQIINHLWTDDD